MFHIPTSIYPRENNKKDCRKFLKFTKACNNYIEGFKLFKKYGVDISKGHNSEVYSGTTTIIILENHTPKNYTTLTTELVLFNDKIYVLNIPSWIETMVGSKL